MNEPSTSRLISVHTEEVSMIRQIRRALCACAAIAAILAAPAVARADVISDWNAIAQTETLLLRPTAHGQMRGIAMVQGAVYDAVNAIVRSHQPYLLDLDVVRGQPFGSQDAAVATAAHDVLIGITDPARHAALDAALKTTLDGVSPDPLDRIRAEGVRVGKAAAATMLETRQGDGFMAAFNPQIGSDPGDWRPIGWPLTPAYDPDGYVGNLKPFLMESQSQFRSKGPNALTSGAYAKDFAEVKDLGALRSATRTSDQTAAAVFWQFAPIALWNPLARTLAARRGLDTAAQARLYAQVNLAAADGAIACWNDKYHWSFWRPGRRSAKPTPTATRQPSPTRAGSPSSHPRP